MGVLACDRKGCDNILCDYVSGEHGYICWECLSELKAKGMCDMGVFMESAKAEKDNLDAWAAYVDATFKSRYEEYE